MKAQHHHSAIHQQLNAIYPPLQREPIVSSAARAIIEQALREDRGLGAGRHIAIVLSLAAVINFAPSSALANITLPGGASAGVTLGSGGSDNRMSISSGGSATNTTINSGGDQQILSGGNATSTVVYSHGVQEVSSGGSATSTTIYSNGNLFISSGGKASAITQKVGGNIRAQVHGGDTQTIITGTNISGSFSLSGGVANGFILYGGTLERLDVYSGGIANNTTLSGGGQDILSGGIASNTTIQSGRQDISSGGSATGTTISGGSGLQQIRSGGSATSTTINSGGKQIVQGNAAEIIINSDGVQQIISGGSATSTTINSEGGQAVFSGGSAINTTISGSDSIQIVLSGGHASGTNVYSGGTQEIRSGANASTTIIYSGGGQTISSGGSATDTTVNRSASQTIAFGANAAATTLSGGSQVLFGSASGTIIHNSGLQNVLSGGSASDTTINSGGWQEVWAGSASATTINSGGRQTVLVGGNASTTTINGGGRQEISSTGSATHTTINSGGLQLTQGNATDTMISSGGEQYIYSGGSATSTTISGTSSKQVVYAGGSVTDTSISSGGYQQVQGSASSTTIDSGGKQTLFGGQSTDITQNVGGNVNVTVLGSDTSTYASGSNELGEFSLSNGSASGFIIYSGGVQQVTAGGSTTSTRVDSGGQLHIFSGGSAVSTLISGGYQAILISGNASSTTIQSGGLQEIEGNATDTIIQSGGEQTVYAGANANSTTIQSGGLQSLNSSGMATDTSVASGATLNVNSGGLVAGTLSVASGGLLEGALTLTNGTNLTGHILITDAASLHSSAGTDTVNLSGSTTQLLYAQTGAQTLGINLSGTGGLTQQGSSTLTLTGNNTYTGATTVSSGTLVGNIASGTALSVAAGAVYDAGDEDRSISTLNGAGSVDMQNHNLTAESGTFNGSLSGTGASLTKTGAGTLTLTGTNSYTGVTSINAGTLVGNIASGTALSVSTGASYKAGSGDRTVSSLNGAGTVDMQGKNLTASSGTFNGTLSGTHDLTKTGSASLTLNTNASLSGTLDLNEGTLALGENKTLRVEETATLGSGSTLYLSDHAKLTAGNVTIDSGATLDVQTQSGTLPATLIESLGAAIDGNFGNILVAGLAIDLGAATILERFLKDVSVEKTSDGKIIQMTAGGLVWDDVAATSAHGTFNVATSYTLTGDLADNTTTSAFTFDWDGKTLTKVGDGTLTLTGNNTYTGATTVSSGTLVGNIASGTALNISAGASYLAGSGDRTVSSLNGAGTVDMQGKNLTASSGTFNGTLSGTHDLTKTGSASLTLDTNTDIALSGDLTVNAGTLVLAQSLTASGSAFLADNTTLDLASSVQLTAGNVTIGNNTTLDVQAMSGADPITLIESTGLAIEGNFNTVKIAGVLLSSSACDLEHFFDSTSVIVQKTSDNKIIQMRSDALIWKHVTPVSAHGTFNVATEFTLNDSLADNTTSSAYAFGWDGKTLTKVGDGTLTLTGNNTYSGATTVSSGTLVGNIANGTALSISAGASYLAGHADRTINSLNGAGTVDMQGKNLTASSGTFNGTLIDTNDLTKTGSGTLTLNSDTTLLGDLHVDGGTLALDQHLTVDGHADFAANTTLKLANNAQLIADEVDIASGATLDVQAQSNTTPIILIQTNNGISGDFTTIKVGGVAMGSGGGSSAPSLDQFFTANWISALVQKSSDDKLLLLQTSTSLGGLVWLSSAAGSAHGTFNVASSFTLTDSLADNTTSSAYAFGWDGKTLHKVGSGTLTLAGNNTYTGATNISAGTLVGNIASGTTLNVSEGASYKAGHADRTINSLNGAGTVDMQGKNLTASSGTFNGTLIDTNNLTKTGKDTLSLANSASFSGALTLNAGTLTLGANVSAGSLALNVGRLELDQILTVNGTASMASGSTLNLADNAQLVAENVTIGSGATLDIAEQSGTKPVTLVQAINQPINGNFASILIGGVAINSANLISLEYFLKSISVEKSSDGKAIQMNSGGLLWNNTTPASAHGTFNVATHFTLTDDLTDNPASSAYAFGWDGKTLTKTGEGTLTLAGNYTYTGGTQINAGALVLDGHNGAGSLVSDIVAVSGTAFQIINGAHFTGSIDPTDVTLSGSNSRWDITGASVVDKLTLANGGNIAFTSPTSGKPHQTLRINDKLDGDGTIVMNTDLAARQGDQIIVTETAGTHTLIINNTGGAPASAGQSLKLIDVSTPELSNGVFSLNGGHVDAGAFRYLLASGTQVPMGDAGDWYLYNTGNASRLSEQSLAMAGTLKYTATAALGNVHQRISELRLDAQNADKNDGDLWLRTYQQDYDNHLYAQAKGKQKINGLTLGIDKRLDLGADTGRVYVGALVGTGTSDFKAKQQNSQMKSTDYQIGAYASWLGTQGSYADLVARALWLDRDYRFDQFNAEPEKVSAKSQAYALALEFGQRIELKDGWFAQPQAQLSWLRSQQRELNTDQNTRITLEKGENLDLRAGLMIGKNLRTAAQSYQFYGKLDRLQSLRAANNVSVNGNRLESNKEGGSWRAGAGLQFSGKASQVHIDLETGLGSADVKQKWAINLGARWQF